jgi:transcriptional accessory protein Tex/SPT6
LICKSGSHSYFQEGVEFFYVEQGQASKEDIERDAPDKIQEALGFIRNSNFEVPFIAFYRKEYVENVLHIQDVWKIFEYDEKVCFIFFN